MRPTCSDQWSAINQIFKLLSQSNRLIHSERALGQNVAVRTPQNIRIGNRHTPQDLGEQQSIVIIAATVRNMIDIWQICKPRPVFNCPQALPTSHAPLYATTAGAATNRLDPCPRTHYAIKFSIKWIGIGKSQILTKFFI